ncbi:uncharacterized protein LOC105697514 isoform X2 [Orussus abietinus]|uniref:uncharacterized protein LOC105697514 isoform X2 n=1 Tax=Orussus abietinus TaxID=222816 RepID=UPI000626ADD3|nr:uncharacterized protein LOC105697514 isoform X2 [Orussus abietinus]
MEVIPMSWLNQILLILSVGWAALSMIIQEWAGLSSLPVYVSIAWAVFVTAMSTWVSCYVLRFTIKASSPIRFEPFGIWLRTRLEEYFKIDTYPSKNATIYDSSENKHTEINGDKENMIEDNINNKACKTKCKINVQEAYLENIVNQIDSRFIEVWYTNISNNKAFPSEAQELLKKLLQKAHSHVVTIDKVRLTNKLADVLLLHLKEYRRALRRVEKGTAPNIEEAYRCQHPGSRSMASLEHALSRLITILAREFLQWELISSLPCKLLLSILAKKLQETIQIMSDPTWIFEKLLEVLHSTEQENQPLGSIQNGIVSLALNNGITSATATIIPRPLSKVSPVSNVPIESETDAKCSKEIVPKRSTLSLQGLEISHRGLWGDVNISEADSEPEDDRLSPVYEEPTDFATTIARLRNLLQQKSTATTPLQAEEKPYSICEGSQFTNLAIPWTEFYTAPDGSQQLLYCIQFDDVEQHGVDLFEPTTATVRRQYSDFVQLHSNLEEVPSLNNIMSDIKLPEGGRIEMESYLKTLCIRLAADSPPQLRHFLRPNSNAGKKADAVAPRLDRFLAKTVTGVFNTLKTVVPGFELDQEEEVVSLPTLMPLADIPWRFVEDIKSRSLVSELQQLVAERIDYCSVDTAYEAVDSVEGSGDSELLSHWWETVNTPYEELEELDCNLTLTRVSLDLLCEILAGIGSNNTLQQEAVIRWTKLLFGNVAEPLIQNIILWISDRLSDVSFSSILSKESSRNTSISTKERIIQLLHTKIPKDLKFVFGEDDIIQIHTFLLGSLEIKKINQDLILQMIDVLASQLLASCRTSYRDSALLQSN